LKKVKKTERPWAGGGRKKGGKTIMGLSLMGRVPIKSKKKTDGN